MFKPQARDLHCVADCVGVGASWGWRRRCLGFPKGRCARRLAQPYRQYLLLCNIHYICFVCLVFVRAFVLSCLSFCHRSQCGHIQHSGVVSARVCLGCIAQICAALPCTLNADGRARKNQPSARCLVCAVFAQCEQTARCSALYDEYDAHG